jgi:hypothetical protein
MIFIIQNLILSENYFLVYKEFIESMYMININSNILFFEMFLFIFLSTVFKGLSLSGTSMKLSLKSNLFEYEYFTIFSKI